ncbi:RsiW-degrading membrane proteinase PrsW (M82 family) [Nocardiopsis arvandica]|uniref:RsiW-degrading membrane proteinase PrsW (M82 family) n=1 Tax=Nocardiopsis sinuspersici TaxID=501010 RepID=A0A7Z0BKT7_9ACTN|nr:RsiW-degrading membrane proteinase PrsW (M82 family) [Nocardiopsis sinuspersici]
MNHGSEEPRAPGATDRGSVPSPRRAHRDGPGRRHSADRGPDGRPGPGRRLPSLVALVLVAVLCAVGLVFLALQFAGLARVFSSEAALAVLLGAVTLAFGFWVLRRIRPVRAPALNASLTAVAWGLTAAPAAGVLANGGLSSIWAKGLGLAFSGVWGPALTAPLNEEVLKLAGIVLVAVAFPHAVRGPVDGFAIGSLVGLGFEVSENFIYSMNAVVQAGGTGGVVPVVQTFILRVGVAGLGSHWAMSAVAGTAVGLLAAAAWRPGTRRAVGAAALVALAMVLHWLVDSPLLGGLPGMLFEVAVVFLTTMAVYFTVRHSYRRRVRGALASEGQALGMRRSASVALASRHGRRGELRHVARPEQPDVERRQEQMLAIAEDRAARYTP